MYIIREITGMKLVDIGNVFNEMCIRDRSESAQDESNTAMISFAAAIFLLARSTPVSYTHLQKGGARTQRVYCYNPE